MPKFSIIVPIYNQEKYLPHCLNSILIQKETDFEVLLIDDGSADNSGRICDEYAVRDSRIKVLHKENGGVSSARNIGIEHAQGDYLTFVDSDDFVSAEYLSSLRPQQNEDFVMDSSDDRSPAFPDGIYNGKDVVRAACSGWQILAPWGKLYKTDIVIQYNIRYDESICMGEDTLFNLEYLLHVSSLRTVSSAEYTYRRDVKGSLSKQKALFQESAYKAYKVYIFGGALAAKCNDFAIEYSISKYAGITWTLWDSLQEYKIAARAVLIKDLFMSSDMLSLMKNYLRCSESGKNRSVLLVGKA